MPLNVDVIEEPGLRSLLEQSEAPARDEAERELANFLYSPGVSGSRVAANLGASMRAQRETTAETAGWWEAVKHWWLGEKHTVVASEEHPVELAAYWMTVPGVHDSKVTVSSSTSGSSAVSASLKIAGIGGGPTLTVQLKETVEFEASSPERAALKTTGTFEKVEVRRLDEQVVGTYVRLSSIDRDNFEWQRGPATPPDPSRLGKPGSSRRFSLAPASPTDLTHETLTLAKGTEWDFGVELSLEKLGLSAELGAKITYEHEVEYAYDLPGGSNYLAGIYGSFPAYLWTIESS